MKAIVVYESFFGNTSLIADAIAEELGCMKIKAHSFRTEMINDYDCIVIGAPTRKFTVSKEIKECLTQISNHGSKVVVFDTRMEFTDSEPKLLRFLVKRFGYATDTMEKILKKHKIETCISSTGFYVDGREGPLREGEIERAKAWISKIWDVRKQNNN